MLVFSSWANYAIGFAFFRFRFRLSCRRLLFARETISWSMVGNGPRSRSRFSARSEDRSTGSCGEDREDSYGGQQVAEWHSSIAVYPRYAGTGMVMDGFSCWEFTTLIGLKSLAKGLTSAKWQTVRPGYTTLVPNLVRQTAPEVKNLAPKKKMKTELCLPN